MRFHGSVRHVAVEVGGFDDARRQPLAFRQAAALPHYARFRPRLPQVLENRPVVGTGRRRLPFGFHLLQRIPRPVGRFGQHRDHPAVLHHPDARHLLRRRRVRRSQLRAVRRRTQNGRVQQPGQHHVAGVFRPSGHLVQPVLAPRRRADHLESRRLHRHIRQVPLDAPALHQLRIGDRVRCVARIANRPRLRAQPLHRHVQPLRRHREQHRLGLRSRPPHRRPEQRRAHGSERAHVVRAQVGIAQHHVDAFERHVQFLGQRHRQFRHRALSQFHLAGQAGHPAVRADLQIGVQVRRPALPRRQPRRLLRRRRVRAEEHEQPGARGQKFAPLHGARRRRFRRFAGHHAPAFGACAASWMASRMRPCAPQRHRLSSMCRTICSRVGCGVRRSSA